MIVNDTDLRNANSMEDLYALGIDPEILSEFDAYISRDDDLERRQSKFNMDKSFLKHPQEARAIMQRRMSILQIAKNAETLFRGPETLDADLGQGNAVVFLLYNQKTGDNVGTAQDCPALCLPAKERDAVKNLPLREQVEIASKHYESQGFKVRAAFFGFDRLSLCTDFDDPNPSAIEKQKEKDIHKN